ncbi:vacuolar protein sorting-associated protein 13 isoform X2 [Pararge aegeria]|uniref:vacuolar protein sorting-associated protein 13 isoform X2 n=1 Tax=Pararge aegeria TaxID=116150 RepID=UPI0019D14F3D|nr:vacuolar protein sorting-associated protein 13 isoform X2 [Pararge aegeria]
MVFESIVVDVLNRFLGDYVENLNRSQLKLGIWGGDVVLENLILKQNALEELNIPVQTVYGHLGKLVLKIPWKNLYGASVEATIERLFLIVNPTAEVKYDPEKEEKMALAAKQAELARVEEAKKKEAEKDDKLDETFVEKLVTQIIKNVQLKISDIHVRYEDSITNPKAPFSFGVTLHNLSVHTTDENWKQTVIQEAVTKIFKILNLEGLAVYWNPATELYSKSDADNIKKRLQGEIATKSVKPSFYKYALGPINATAKLKLNPKPEGDTVKFSIPKVILSLHMEQLFVSLTKSQYQDMMLLADSMDRMTKGAPYRKYRPDLKIYRGHYKAWWHFAFKCILEEEVKRRRRNWDWNHMLSHRQLCKDYASAYQCQLSNKGKISTENKCVLDKAEKTLDLLNLVVIRQRIEMEVERLGKLEEEAKKSRGWFSGWWSGASSKDDELSEGVAIMKQFEKAMTQDEKEKLFRAIDYQENTAPLHLPTEYVAVEGYFRLDKLQVSVNDQVEVLRACVENVEVDLKQRPSANALRVDVQMRAFTVTGKCQGDLEPQLVTSKEVSKDINLLNVLFETNPLDGACDQRVKVQARPLQIIYDAQTVIEIVKLFKPPTESSALTTLQAAAENKLSDLKEKSALGMQYAVHHHTFIELDIDIAASYIIIPQTGIYKGEEACAVVKLGAISVKSAPRAAPLDVHALHRQGLPDQDILSEIAKHSYDRMALRLTEMQIVIASPKEDWHSAIASNVATPLHLLQPTNLVIQIHKCLITDDPRLPKIKIMGELQKIAVSVSEDRLLTLCEILVSMPLPQSEEATQLKASDSKGSSLSLLKYLDPVEKQKRDTARSKHRKENEHTVQLTEVEAFFIMKELVISVNRKTLQTTKEYDKFLVFSLNLLEIKATQKTFTLEVTVRLGSVDMQHHRAGQKIISMIVTPELTTEVDATDKMLTTGTVVNQYLFAVTYSNVDKKCPEFRSHFGSVEQMIELDFTRLKVLLHLQGLQEILVVINEYQTRLQAIQSTVDRYANAGPLETIAEDEEFSVAKSKASIAKPSRRKQVESIQLKVNVKIGAVEIEFATDIRPLSIVKLQGAAAGLILKSSYTQVDCTIASIKVEDLNPVTVHKEILKVLGGDVINVQIVMYNLDQYPTASDVNMSIDAQINCLRIVFLNWFVSSMLEFLNNFQTAQEAIIEASSQAADAARANVQNAYQNSTKLALRVRLAAPIIIVPENSSSLNAVLVDLGRMNLNNKFVDVPAIDVDNKVTVDELMLELEDMKVSCVMLKDDDEGVVHERKLLRPTSFKLFVKRSLSSWYESLPDLDISGRMKTIAITVGHSDYKSIMKILNQNLQEGQTKTEEAKSQPSASKATSKITVKSQTSRIQAKSTVTMVTPSKEQAKMPRTTIKFAFTMDSFVIDLMNTGSDDSMLVKDMDLARFCLALLSVKGRMFSDGSMNTSVLLVDCTLDDTRPGRGAKITRYLERRRENQDSKRSVSDETVANITETHEKIRSMIDITYTMKNGDTFVDMRIFSFNLILAMDFLNKIAEFMTTGLSDATPESIPKEDIKAIKLQAEKSADSMNRKKVSVVSAPVMTEQKVAMMTVNIKIEQPDIILVESLEQRECDALVLNMEMRLKLRKTEERMVADGAVSGMQVTVRRLGAQTSPAAPRFLLAPAHLSLALSQPPGQGMHLDIALTDIKITVSPEILALLNRVLATVTSREEDSVEQENQTIFYKRLWDIQPFKPTSYWFLKTEVAEEAIDLEESTSQEVVIPPVGEICLMSSPSIVLALEMEIGNETIPVLVMQASLSGQAKDWSSDFYMESTWAMQVSYYNIGRAMWEPLIEPVEILKDSQYKHIPWELRMEVVMRPQENMPSIDTSDDAANIQAVAQRLASKTITVSSSELLEITITRSGMEVLSQLGNSFAAAVGDTETSVVSKSKIDDSKSDKKYLGAPYVLHNCTGLTAKLSLVNNNDFSVFMAGNVNSDFREVLLEPGASVPLQLKHGGLNVMKLNEPPPPLKLNVKIMEMDEEIQIPVERADKRYFPIGRRMTSEMRSKNISHAAAVEARGLISDVVMHDAALHIYLRSIVQVTNTLSVAVSVYFMTLSGNEVRLLGEVAPGDTLRLPLQAVHTPTAEIFFSVEGFTVSVSPFVWRELQQEVKLSKLLQCDSKDKNSGEKFYLRAVGTMEQVFFEHSNRHTFASSCYDIVLKPAVKLQNCLPVPVIVSQLGLRRTQLFEPGEMFHLSHLAPNRASIVIMIQNYLDKCWVCTKNLPDELEELSVWSFESHDSPSVMTLELGLHSADMEGTQLLSLYCPFWMLNKTGFTLCYRIKHSRCSRFISRHTSCLPNVDETGNVIFHPKDYKEPILFSFRAKNFFGKKKAAIRVEFGEWSDKFSLDVPGSSGVVICKNEGRSYQVAVTNQLTFNSLTKMVIFTPFFLIINECPFPIQYQELHRSGDPWGEVKQNSSAPLWPMVEKEDKLLLLRVACSTQIAAPFLYTEQHSVCLKLDNEYGGLHVEVQLSEGGTYVTVRQYRDGHAPALLVNYTPHGINVYEKENVNVRKLPSMNQMLYTWDNPAGPRILLFEGHKRKEIENDLRKDGIGDFMINESQRIWWVSFLDGLQRVILFTDDPILASGAHTIGEAEPVHTEFVLAMHGLGLSLVNDPELTEILYVSISNSGIIWEQCKIGSRRYKKIEGVKAIQIEEAYQKYLAEKMVSDSGSEVPPRVKIDDKTEVDFAMMSIIRPYERLVRRTHSPGVWAVLGLTAHSRRLHARLHRLQVDQQLPLPTFPVMLAPVPPPKSVANDDPAGTKPFIEVSIVERIMEHSKVRQYKYYKVLIQEFHVKVDMGLINALMGMFPQKIPTEQEALDAFEVDIEKARQPLEALAAMGAASDMKNFYDNLHLSPLKVHVSFSLGGATQLPTFVGTVLQSIGVTLTDMNDVVFKLSYYERNYEFLSQKELIGQVQSHYTGQALKQLYVLVLGLDVIGNPYGLVIGLKKGVEDLFYEPFQGAIQGPGEFAEGLMLGVRSLVGHTVGGAAGAVSRITGAMGHGLAALSLDKDYQRRRRDNINKPPANLQEGLARSGKGLVMGVVDGVTGVFTKPIEGAREQGVEGFFKGLGVGAVGLVARPTAGVVDFASGSFDAVKRAADMSEEVTKRRAARYLAPDAGVRPYSRLQAEGYKMLSELEKGKFVSTDTYEAHVWVIPAKEVVMCTDKRLLYLEKNNVFGGWQIVWTYLWSEIPDVPTAVAKGVYIPTAKRKVLGMFPSSGSGKVIFLYDEQQKKFLLAQCERLMRPR